MSPENCGYCQPCARGDYSNCETFPAMSQQPTDAQIIKAVGLNGFYSDAECLVIGKRVLALQSPAVETLTESYVQTVPDKCDRIVWRNRYYHLPELAPAVETQAVPEDAPDTMAMLGKTLGGDVLCNGSTGRYLSDHIEELIANRLAARAAETQVVLAELVALQDLEKKANALHFAGPLSDAGEHWKAVYDTLRRDFIYRQPIAWEAARAALATQPPKETK